MGRLFISLLICLLISPTVQAYEGKVDHTLNLLQATIITPLGTLGKVDCNCKIAARPYLQNNRTTAEAAGLVLCLKKLLNGEKIHVVLNKIPHQWIYSGTTV